jgi:hypothetical protein
MIVLFWEELYIKLSIPPATCPLAQGKKALHNRPTSESSLLHPPEWVEHAALVPVHATTTASLPEKRELAGALRACISHVSLRRAQRTGLVLYASR